jgi:hypothetical protein
VLGDSLEQSTWRSSVPSCFLNLPFQTGNLAVEPREVPLPLRIARHESGNRRNDFATGAKFGEGCDTIAELDDVGGSLGVARLPSGKCLGGAMVKLSG